MLTVSRALACAAAVWLAACTMPTHPDASAPPPDPFNPATTQLLDDTHWQLHAWTLPDGSARALPADARLAADAQSARSAQPALPTLDLSTASGERRASGFAGCNRFVGTYTLKNGLLSFSPLAATRMACVNSGGDLEHAYLDAFAHVAHSGVQMHAPQQLLLVLDDGSRLTFTRRQP